MRAVAGRLGYCALDRTRAVLQGDEIRACWQAPVRVETFEGLFRDLEGEAVPSGSTPAGDAETATAATRRPGGAPGPIRERDEVSTRAWVIPVVSDDGGRGPSGLRDATYVPARSGVRETAPTGGYAPGSDDPEALGVVQHLTVGEGDPDGDQAVTHHSVLGDLDA